MRFLNTAVLCTALAAPALAQTPAPGAWVHVRVQETAKDSSVAINLPMSVMQAAIQAAPDKIVTNGKVQFGGDQKMQVADLKKAWLELAKAGDAELVSVQEKNEKVSVRRSAGKLLVNVDKTTPREQVRIEIPASVVDAFFSASGDEVNLKAALDAMQHIRGDLVKVDDSKSSVRIWIDEKP
jgi:DNA-binding protein YbaB